MNQRRLLMLTLAAGLADHVTPLRAQTPAASPRRVGVLAPSTREKEEVTLKPFFDQMHRLGWVEGQTIADDRAMPTTITSGCPRWRSNWWRVNPS